MKKNDIATYWRLLGYLHGTRKIVVAVIALMVLEALFTILTIASTKPVLDLIFRDRFLDVSKYTEERDFRTSRMPFPDSQTVTLRAFGKLTGRRAMEDITESVHGMLRKSNKQAIMDLSEVTVMDPNVWPIIYSANLRARANSARVIVVTADTTSVPLELMAAVQPGAFDIVTSSSPGAAEVRAAFLDKVAVPVPKPKKERGWIQQLKVDTILKVAPTIERVQDYAIESREHKFLVLSIVVGVMVIFAFLKCLCGFGVGYLSSYMAQKLLRRLREHIYSHMTALDMNFYMTHSTGALMSLPTQDVPAIGGSVEILFSSVLKTPVTVLTLVTAMYMVSPSLTFYSFAVLPGIALILYMVGRRVRSTSRSIQQARQDLSALMQEAFSGARIVKAYNMEEREIEKYNKESTKIFRMSVRVQAMSELGGSATELLGIITVALMMLGGGYYVLKTGDLNGSDFIIFVGLMLSVFRPLKSMNHTNNRLQRGLAGCDRVFRILDISSSIVDKPRAIEIGELKRNLAFDNVSFEYDPKRGPVLRNVNLTIPKGKAVAFVGETGAGKSTLVNLLPRFYDPTGGAVKYDGIDLRDIAQVSLRNQIALITQDVILFDDTIANNIAYGSPQDVSRDQIEAAAIAANAHRFIMAKPQGYDTQIGSRGGRLSGGERQRLAIARAILKNSPILILDEATSSLDSETEQLIQEALENLMVGRTVLVIAHRLSTIQHCDEIYVLENGVFVEHGTHEELLRAGGRYAHFHSIQFAMVPASREDEPPEADVQAAPDETDETEEVNGRFF